MCPHWRRRPPKETNGGDLAEIKYRGGERESLPDLSRNADAAGGLSDADLEKLIESFPIERVWSAPLPIS